MSSVTAWHSAAIGTLTALNALGIFKIVGRWWREEPLREEELWVRVLKGDVAGVKRRVRQTERRVEDIEGRVGEIERGLGEVEMRVREVERGLGEQLQREREQWERERCELQEQLQAVLMQQIKSLRVPTSSPGTA